MDMERITNIYNCNRSLFEEWSYWSVEEFEKSFDNLFREHMGSLKEILSKKDFEYLKGCWLRNFYNGRDNCPACIKVIVTWNHSVAFTPRDRDYVEVVRAEFDRIKSQVKYSAESHNKLNGTIKADLSEQFEDKFFGIAEHSFWERRDDPTYMMDGPQGTVKCFFSDGYVAESKGNFPDYYPYNQLYEMSQVGQVDRLPAFDNYGRTNEKPHG